MSTYPDPLTAAKAKQARQNWRFDIIQAQVENIFSAWPNRADSQAMHLGITQIVRHSEVARAFLDEHLEDLTDLLAMHAAMDAADRSDES